MRRTAQVWTLVAALVAAAFALRTLLLIDATALWSDELYSVGKSFQPSPLALLGMLRWWGRWRHLQSPQSARQLMAEGWQPGPTLGEELRRRRGVLLDQGR